MYNYINDIEDLKTGVVFKHINTLILELNKDVEKYSGKEALNQAISEFVSFTYYGLKFEDMIEILYEYKESPIIIEAMKNLRKVFLKPVEDIAPKTKDIQQYEQLIVSFIIGYVSVSIMYVENMKGNFGINVNRLLKIITD